ncbi:MAG TPA: zf-HC2 domain-containing protein [Bryobacteraceae bacterium]|nr:zf-HC2 domain-containing protein [Bryobacteraceae bacterium]
MNHPDQAALALYAGGDLGFWARWRVERHLAQCEGCGEEVAAFAAAREIVTDLAEIPDVSWNHLAAEMKANIRLGLAAGECVRMEKPLRDHPWFTGVRTVVALASIITLAVTGLVMEPHSRPHPIAQMDGHTVLQGIQNGIEVEGSGRAFRLMNTGATDVTFSVGAQGSMGARYVDPNTGQVTINNVYAE